MGFIKHADVPMKDVKILTPEEAAAQMKTVAQTVVQLAAQTDKR